MVERNVWVLFAVLASFGLSGCFATGGSYSQASAQQPSQEILDGTFRNPQDWSDPPLPRTVRRAAKVTIGAVGSIDARAAAEAPKVYSDEWWAKENRDNERLKNRMTICRGC